MSERDAMAALIGELLDGETPEAEALVFLRDLDIHTLTAEALAGAVDAVMERAVPFPAFPHAVDGCGTGGDDQYTFNISTAAALVAAACGVTVAKHGNRAVTSQSGSADVLEALGVNTQLSPARSAELLDKIGVTFLFAPTFHPGFAHIAPLRKKIRHRTLFNLLGPLCNPARVQHQLIGVFDAAFCPLIAQTCKLLGRQHVMVVHGDDGSDEISVIDTTQASILVHGAINKTIIRPHDAGIEFQDAGDLIGGDAATNAAALRAVLNGEQNAYAEAIIINAAAMLLVAGKASTLHDGARCAREAIASGAAKNILQQLITASAHG
jgi:anthranilate phosphoribosyltransferase